MAAALTRPTRIVAFAGAGLGAVLGALGVGTSLSILAAVPILLLPLPILGAAGWWYARTRQGAAAIAVGFASAVTLAQWPFSAWYVQRLPRGAVPHATFAAILMMFVGLALSPLVVALIRRRSAGASL